MLRPGAKPRGGTRPGRARPRFAVRGSGRCPAGSDAGSTSPSASSPKPELLFLDEPTTGFDPEARRQFWELIRLLADDGTTILLTTHYLEEAAALADRVAVIAGGRVVAVDSPARLTAHANSAATVRWMEGDRAARGADRPSDRTDQAALERRGRTGSADGHPADARRRVSAPDRARRDGDRVRGARLRAQTPRGRRGSALPSPLRIGLSRVIPELKMFYRRPEQVALTFSMPAVICLLLGSIFSAKLPDTQTSTGAVIAASMLAYGILSTSFINLGISIAADRDTGALRRLRGTPATASSYFIGKIMLVAIVSLAEAVILLLVGVLVFRLQLPTDVFGWWTLDMGLRPRHRQLFAAGHLHQQLRQQRGLGRRHHQRPGGRPAVRVGYLRAAHGAADVDVDRRIDLPRQVDGPGLPFGAVAGADGGLRTGGQLGALADRSWCWRHGASAA